MTDTARDDFDDLLPGAGDGNVPFLSFERRIGIDENE
jgi:hypothetical protein